MQQNNGTYKKKVKNIEQYSGKILWTENWNTLLQNAGHNNKAI